MTQKKIRTSCDLIPPFKDRADDLAATLEQQRQIEAARVEAARLDAEHAHREELTERAYDFAHDVEDDASMSDGEAAANDSE